MNAAHDDLDDAIEELCVELFLSRTPDDALSILHAATVLAASSRVARGRVGRALDAEQDHLQGRAKSSRIARFKLLAERYLYDPVSSASSLALLAVLAQDHLVNQRRIARHLRGICIVASPPTSYEPLHDKQLHPHCAGNPSSRSLLILSLPTSLRAQYKLWRSRNLLLQGCRVPTGTPPSREGVPMPCFCDNCLGSPQLLQTWIDHYQDLSRWTSVNDDHNDLQPTAPSQLRSEAFLQTVLNNDYSLSSCPWTHICSNPGEAPHGPLSPAVYFFTPTPSVEQQSMGQLPRAPDPLRDVCAIEIDQSVALSTSTCRRREGNQRVDHSLVDEESVDRIVIFHQQAPLSRCSSRNKKTARVSTKWSSPSDVASFSEEIETLLGDASTLTVEELQELVGASHVLGSAGQAVLCDILQFLDPKSVISPDSLQHTVFPLSARIEFGHHRTKPQELPLEREREPEVHDVQVLVTMSNEMVEITARSHEGTTYARSLRVAALPEGSLSSSLHHVCALDDESLLELIQHCRLCQDHAHETEYPGRENGWICLTLKCVIASGSESLTSPSVEMQQGLQEPDDHTAGGESCNSHMHGLSPVSERLLQNLAAELTSGAQIRVDDVARHVQKLIHDCNARMTEMACNSSLSLSLRAGARERCRACRDSLIQIGKRLKLGVRDAPGALSDAARRRLQREIDRVVHASESLDSWEAPDPRVQQMHLNERVWASGRPDPEFYANSEARSRANRAAQRRLNQRLVDRVRQRLKS